MWYISLPLRQPQPQYLLMQQVVEDENRRRDDKDFSLFQWLGVVNKKSFSGQFAYNRQSERVEIMGMKLEGMNVKSLLK